MECTIAGKNCKNDISLVKCKHCEQQICSSCLIDHIYSKMKGETKADSSIIILPQKMDDVECVYCRKRYTKEYLYSIHDIVDNLIEIEQKLMYTMYHLEENERIICTNRLVDELNDNISNTRYNYSSGFVIINNKPLNFDELLKKVQKFEKGLTKIKQITEDIEITNRINIICKILLDTYAVIYYDTVIAEYNSDYSDNKITISKLKNVLEHHENKHINYTNTYIYNVNPSREQLNNTAWLYPDYSITEIKKLCNVLLYRR